MNTDEIFNEIAAHLDGIETCFAGLGNRYAPVTERFVDSLDRTRRILRFLAEFAQENHEKS